MLKEFKTLSFEDKEINLLQDNVQQFLEQLKKFPTLPIGIDNFRIPRPAYKYYSSTQIIIPGSTAKPLVFVISGVIYTLKANLICDVTLPGAGGLDDGAISANTIYYLYVVVKNGVILPILSLNAPSTNGPKNFPLWTYIGAVPTISAGALAPFVASHGRLISPATIQESSHSGNTVLTALTLLHPLTAKFAIGTAKITGTVAGGTTFLSGFNDSTNATHSVVLQVSGIECHNSCEIELDSPTTIYVRNGNVNNTSYWRVHGWVEDPTEVS